ncbi:PREDICTED: uncharacterized protein LOC108766689 isoform X2 [Trachymyrmex cornetzi]|uniref:uncharacterized protein LOC108766689 isoform X2 n=1 Tax=Trachymyrmex cornetzi TaxID=471704 RepID=UPI00084F7F05|nr:PREDICTED: uncharacterized protein LOC108766689 isoform X2 [Trachymyrmex cornetzi]
MDITVQRNVGRNWCAWKQNFLSFLQKEDAKEMYKNQWTVILLMLIGPDGEEVYKRLFQNAHQIKDLEIVLLKLDIFFIFGLKEKQESESIDLYIDCLMLAAVTSKHNDPTNIVKEKIIKDIKNYNFTGKAMIFIQSKGELVSYLQSLDLDNIILFWKQCEKLMSQRNHEDTQTQLSSDLNPAEMECIRCGTCHSRHRCPAHGVQCDNCKGYNHFMNKCKGKYVSNCSKCGMSHVQSRCRAFGQTCVKCGKLNHFSWLCKVPVVRNCFRCGKNHAISMCPAQGYICSRCNKPNHFEQKCLSK